MLARLGATPYRTSGCTKLASFPCWRTWARSDQKCRRCTVAAASATLQQRAHHDVENLIDLFNDGARLTTAAQLAWKQVVQPGDTVVDATSGNGHDTLFLSKLVGPSGIVYAIDVQEAALASTKERLAAGLQLEEMPSVQYVHGCHSNLQQYVGSLRARVVCFNLGYLPASDNKQIITQASTTTRAIESALEVLLPGGLISIVAYTRHPGATEEYAAVQELLRSLTPSYWCTSETQLLNRPTAPVLMLVWRRLDQLPPLKKH